MQNISEEILRAKAQGAREVAKFTGAIPPEDLSVIEQGDVITIPQNFTVLEQNIRNSTTVTQYCHADAVSKSGEQKVIQFYPSYLVRNLEVVDELGDGTGVRKKTTGDVVAEYRKGGVDPQKGMEMIAGKPFIVANKEVALTAGFGSDKTRKTPFFEFNFVSGGSN